MEKESNIWLGGTIFLLALFAQKLNIWAKINTNIIRSMVNGANLNPVNFGYFSNNDRLKGNDSTEDFF